MLERNIQYLPNADIPTSAGVYMLKETNSGKVYIGSAVNLQGRIATHRSNLTKNKHGNRELQELFEKGNVTVEILVALPVRDSKKVKEIEKYFLLAAEVLFPNGVINKHLYHQKRNALIKS